MTSDIILTTLNSTYQHSSFGLRYILANLDHLTDRAKIIEYTIKSNPRDIVENLLQYKPKIVGIGVYIWNAKESFELVSILKKVSPETIIILGGPEVSHESETNPICELADYTVKGEADFAFREICDGLLNKNETPARKYISPPLPDIKKIVSPYHLYADDDIKNRVVYVEVSRGCPYRCEYCLSSLDKLVRNFDVDIFLQDMQMLLDRGLRQFKFIDRTFNLSPTVCTKILQFFLDRIDLGLFLHFEMVPDRLPDEIKNLIVQFPKGSLQFEIGIQTWNTEVAKLVSRRNDLTKVQENFKYLASETGVHSHADLIVGLPGEDVESFAKGFDILASLAPDEIQVGILKRLKGAPISRHDKEWEMVYSDQPPFQILKTKMIDFSQMQSMVRFAKFWDLYANSGIFGNFVSKIKEISKTTERQSFFWSFYSFSEYLSGRYAQTFGISQLSLFESAVDYTATHLGFDRSEAIDLLAKDYYATGKKDVPKFFRTEGNIDISKYETPVTEEPSSEGSKDIKAPKRQQQHAKGHS